MNQTPSTMNVETHATSSGTPWKATAGRSRIAIISASWHTEVVYQARDAAQAELQAQGVQAGNIQHFSVPGAFEIPLVAKKMAQSGKYDGIICLGAVIRGATSHYDYVCNEVAKGVAQVGLASGVPTIFGVVTTENIEQAIERAGTKAGNKGYDGAMAAIEMANLLKQM